MRWGLGVLGHHSRICREELVRSYSRTTRACVFTSFLISILWHLPLQSPSVVFIPFWKLLNYLLLCSLERPETQNVTQAGLRLKGPSSSTQHGPLLGLTPHGTSPQLLRLTFCLSFTHPQLSPPPTLLILCYNLGWIWTHGGPPSCFNLLNVRT